MIFVEVRVVRKHMFQECDSLRVLSAPIGEIMGGTMILLLQSLCYTHYRQRLLPLSRASLTKETGNEP